MSAGGATHYTDSFRVQTVVCGLATNEPDRPLKVLPCRYMLHQPALCRRPGGAVFHGHYGHSKVVEVASCWGNLEPVRIVARVAAAGIYNLDCCSLEDLRKMPFYIGSALPFLGIRHLPFRPYRLFDDTIPCLIGREAVHELDFWLKFSEKSHLSHEFNAPFKAEGPMALAGIEVQLCRDSHPTELTVDLGGSAGGIRVHPAVMKAHRAGLLVEFENGREFDFRTVTHHGRAVPVFSVGGRIGGSIDDGPVDMAWDIVGLIDPLVCRSLGTRCKKQGEVGSG